MQKKDLVFVVVERRIESLSNDNVNASYASQMSKRDIWHKMASIVGHIWKSLAKLTKKQLCA